MSQTLSHFSETFFSKFHLPFHSVLLIPALGLKLLPTEISTQALFLTFLHGSLWKGKDGCQPISPIVCAVHRPPKAVDNASVIVSRLSSCIQLRVLEAAGHIGLLGSLPYTFIGPSPISKQTAHQISLSEIPPFTVPPTHQVNEKLAKDLPGFMVPTSLVPRISQRNPYICSVVCGLWRHTWGIPNDQANVSPYTTWEDLQRNQASLFLHPSWPQTEEAKPRKRGAQRQGQGLSDHQMAGSLALGACLHILLGDRLATGWLEEPALS